jgi:hypothetical protein
MRTRLLIGLAVAVTAATAGEATSRAAGIAPGFAPDGILDPTGHVRYLAPSTQHTTLLKAVRVPGGKLLRFVTLEGVYGVPAVTYDGAAGGLSRDGKTLILTTFPGTSATTRFLLVDTRTFAVRYAIRLGGFWSFDALSPDMRTMYLIQFTQTQGAIHYLVRAFDLRARRLVKGVVADKTEPGAMTGLPMSRAVSRDGTWAYTLYDKGDGHSAFIHALDTASRVAVCIDLDLPGAFSAGRVTLTLSPDERRLVVRAADGTVLKTVSAPGY